jgi:hypothetical protein
LDRFSRIRLIFPITEYGYDETHTRLLGRSGNASAINQFYALDECGASKKRWGFAAMKLLKPFQKATLLSLSKTCG